MIRLCFVAALCCLALVPLESNPSLFARTRSQIGAGATSYSWEEANVSPNHIFLAPDLFVSRVAQVEVLSAAAALCVLACLGIAGWVVAGFRRV